MKFARICILFLYFFQNERNITTSLLMIQLKCTVVHYANLNSSFKNKPFLNYGSLNMLFRLFRFLINIYFNQGRSIRRTTIFIFSFYIGLVTQLNGSALGVLKHHYIIKRIRELLIGNSRFLIYNSLNQLRTIRYKRKF